MPVTLLTAAADTVGRTIYTSGAVAPVAGLPLLAWFISRDATPLAPGISGLGATWSYVDGVNGIFLMNAGGTDGRITIAQGLTPTGVPGTVAWNCGVAQDGAIWGIGQCDALIDPVNPVVQLDQANAATAAVAFALAAFSNPLNETFQCVGIKLNTSITLEGGWTELHDTPMVTPNTALAAGFLASPDTTPTALWASAAEWAGFALELRRLPVVSTSSGGKLLRRFSDAP